MKQGFFSFFYSILDNLKKHDTNKEFLCSLSRNIFHLLSIRFYLYEMKIRISIKFNKLEIDIYLWFHDFDKTNENKLKQINDVSHI